MSALDDLTVRLQRHGPGSLAPVELLALLLDAGPNGEDPVDTSRGLLQQLGGIRRLGDVAPADLQGIPVSPVAVCRVLAALELGRRVFQAGLGERTVICGPEDVAREFSHLRDERREHFCAILLDSKGHILKSRTVSIGALDTTVVQPREVFREAVREGAASVIVAHNHPSGDPEPSEEDLAVTRRLAEAARILGVDLLDHVILGENRHVSLHERGVI
ncbi:MAG: DNA repair protein RadC [Fimbriimonadia bacterium]